MESRSFLIGYYFVWLILIVFVHAVLSEVFPNQNETDDNKDDILAQIHIPDMDFRTRFKRNLVHNDWCSISLQIRNGNMDCTMWTYKKECRLSCRSGYMIKKNEQNGEAFKCDRKVNTWEPQIETCVPGGEKEGKDSSSTLSQFMASNSMSSDDTKNEYGEEYYYYSEYDDDEDATSNEPPGKSFALKGNKWR